MNNKTLSLFLSIAVFFFSVPSYAGVSQKPLNALLVTGQANKYHNWRASSAVIGRHIKNTGLFQLETLVVERNKQALKDFSPSWSKYDVVILDYEGEEWSKKTKKKFVNYIENGGGLVVIHASNNSFPHWQAYNKIIGIGGWGAAGNHDPVLSTEGTTKGSGRDERWGPRVYWSQGRISKDLRPSRSFHPPRHDFIATVRNFEHPITRGLPESWLISHDELYSGLRGPAENMTVLVTGLANPSKPPISPYHEPIHFVVNHKKGRIFHTTLGHVGKNEGEDALSVNDVAFSTLIQRGAEWAATGEVSQQIPDAFPNPYQKSQNPSVDSAWHSLIDKTLSQWDVYLGVPHPSVALPKEIQLEPDQAIGLGKNVNNIYSTYEHNGDTILHITGEIYAGLTSKKSYKNYHLQTKMRWGEKKWPPRLDKKRDSGILYHAYGDHGAFWKVWKKSLEYQVQEQDMGDFITVGDVSADVRHQKQDKRSTYAPQKKFKHVPGEVYVHATIEVDRPHGEWNTIDLYVFEDQAIHLINGRVVMALKNAKNHKGEPLKEGQLQIQSEGAVVEYKEMKIRPINKLPDLLKQKAKL